MSNPCCECVKNGWLNVIFDLHSHSNYSDGLLTPAHLVANAVAQNVDVLALTDHDCVNGIEEALVSAKATSLTLIPGVEVSASWYGQTIHVLGLGVDIKNKHLNQGIDTTRQQRLKRAIAIDEGLSGLGVSGALQAICKEVSAENLTRTHFARFLVAVGLAKDMRTAFNRYLKKGKSGYVNTLWVDLDKAVEWIRAAGGIALIAHPGRYKMTATKMNKFLCEFNEMGGEGIEVVTGRSDSQEIGRFAKLCKEYGFYASQGSDFHEPTRHGVKLGVLHEMPMDLKPVWKHPSFIKYLDN